MSTNIALLKRTSFGVAAVAAVLAFMPTAASAESLPNCSITDLTGATACSGYFGGNLNSGSPANILAQQDALSAIGFDWDGDFSAVEKLETFDGQQIDFDALLTGISYVSVHWGAGQGPVKTRGGTTGFYRIDAGTGLDVLMSAFGSVSNAVLYNPGDDDGGGGTPGGIPEPAVWLQLMLGFGLAGAAVRRRAKPVAVTA